MHPLSFSCIWTLLLLLSCNSLLCRCPVQPLVSSLHLDHNVQDSYCSNCWPVNLFVIPAVVNLILFFCFPTWPPWALAPPNQFWHPSVTVLLMNPSAQTCWPFSSSWKAFQSTPSISLVCSSLQNVIWSACKSVNTWHSELHTTCASRDCDLNESSQAINTM